MSRELQRREKRLDLATACTVEITRKSELELAKSRAAKALTARQVASQAFAAELIGDVIESFKWESTFAEQHAESYLVAFVDKLLGERLNVQGVTSAISHASHLAQKHQGKACYAELEWVRKNRKEPVDDAEAEA